MNRSRSMAFALALLLAACTSSTPSESASQPAVTPEATPTPRPEASASVAPSAEPSEAASAGASQAPSGFTVMPNPEADSLFLDRDDCENREDGYQLEFPEEWYTNTEIGDVPACSWFSPSFYEVSDPGRVPDEIAIQIVVIESDRGYTSEPVSREEVIVGATQNAVRVEVAGTSDSDEGMMYEYVVQLGPTFEEGPNLIARTDTDMGGDYELNKAVLDRIMATIEFIGSIQ